jgi:high-affinity iron transporter
MSTIEVPSTRPRPVPRAVWWALGAVVVAALVALMATADTGPVDPTEQPQQSAATAIANSAIIVFREGLEAVLILAAVTAGLVGPQAGRRRPIVLGAVTAFGATVLTWFAVQALLDAASPLGPRLEAITGFLAIVVLLTVMNWFVHRVYWSEWIGRHHRRRRSLLAGTGAGVTVGLVLLGFTSVYREGFETVLFLQALDLQRGTTVVIEGLLLGLAGTAAVGVATFALQRRLPYKKMLVVTGLLLGAVLCVMVGGTAATFQDLGWLPEHALPFAVPGWLGAWFEVYPTWEGIACQVAAAAFVIGSYVAAERVKRRRLAGAVAARA